MPIAPCPSAPRVRAGGPRARIARWAPVAAVLIAAAGGWADDEPSGPPPPLSAAARIHPDNALIAMVAGELAAPGSVVVDYWPVGGGAVLRSAPVASHGTSFGAGVFRLRAATEYRYQVRAVGADGRLSAPTPAAGFTTGELPAGLRDAVFDVWRGAPTLPVTFLEFRQSEFFGLAAFDGDGHVVWYFQAPEGEQPYVMARRPNGNIVYLAGFKGGTTAAGLVEIDPMGRELQRLSDECAPFGPMHHEVQVLPDGRVLYLSRDVLWDGHGEPAAPQEGDTLGVWDAEAGTASIVWNIFDHLSPADRVEPASNRSLPGHPMWGGCDRDTRVQDWSHGNSAVMADAGSVLVSLGHLNQVISIAPDLASVRWRLGGPGSDFTFEDPSDRFYAQHTALPLASGNVLLFDNGTGRPYDEGGQFSRALELELTEAKEEGIDLERMTARMTAAYGSTGTGRRCTRRAAPACSACRAATPWSCTDRAAPSAAAACSSSPRSPRTAAPSGKSGTGRRASRTSTGCTPPSRSWASPPCGDGAVRHRACYYSDQTANCGRDVPTILRHGPYRLFFYAADRNEPEHVHVERDNRVAKFWLDPVRLQQSGGLQRAEIYYSDQTYGIERMIEENQTTLLEAWNEFFGN